MRSTWLLLAAACRAEVFNLDDVAPWIMSEQTVVRWGTGWDALTIADSSCVRVNARGVFAKPSHWTPRARLEEAGWARRACWPGGEGNALCTSTRGTAFPSERHPWYNANATWPGAGCTRAEDRRVLDASQPGYDLSACDVLDDGGDATVCGRVAWTRRTGVTSWVYWTLCLLAVLIVRAMSYLVVKRIQPPTPADPLPTRDETRPWIPANALTVAACVAALPLTLIPDGDAVFVTEEERFFFLALCGYVAVYATLFVMGGRTGVDPPIYNLIAATLQVIASRLYTGAETPYNPILIWAVMTRALVKLRSGFELVTSTTVLIDSMLLALMCVLGFPYSPPYLVAVACAALTTADVFC